MNAVLHRLSQAATTFLYVFLLAPLVFVVLVSINGGAVPSFPPTDLSLRWYAVALLVVEPSILILDEPFGALDRKLREAMQTELYRITRELGITALFVTHDQEEALMLSDSVAVMNQGRIEQVGSPRDLYERPRNRFVAEFMGLSNFVRAQVLRADDAGSLLEAFGHRFEAPAASVAAGQTVEVALRPERIRLSARQPADAVGVQGRITQAIYHGSASDYTVRLPDGSLLSVRQGADDGFDAGQPDALAVGAPVWARWQRTAVHILHA